MSLLAEIKKDQLAARKDKNTAVTSILTTLIGEASMAGKNDGNRESTDFEVVAVIKKFIKNLNELMEVLSIEDDRERYYAAMDEIVVLTEYLPSQLSEDEIKCLALIQISYLDDASPKSMGKIMKHFKDNYAGEYDGKMASKIVRGLLNA